MEASAAGLKGFYSENPRLVWLALVVVPFAFLLVGLVLAPKLFYDQFIWEHLWGPVFADGNQAGSACLDAGGRTFLPRDAGYSQCAAEGTVAREGYTLVSEAVYGLLLAASVFAIYVNVLKRHAVRTDSSFLLALIPFIALGPIARTLEDSSLFRPPYSYFFISPVIYVQIAVYVLAFMMLGIHFQRAYRGEVRRTVPLFAGAMGVFVALHAAATTADPAAFAYVLHPVAVLLFALLGVGLFKLQIERGANPVNATLFSAGVAMTLPPLFHIARWTLVGQWGAGGPVAMYPNYLPFVLVPAVGITALVLIAGRRLSASRPYLAPYALAANGALVFAHMLDGFATFFAVCSSTSASAPCHGAAGFGLNLIGYGEKHPVSNFLLTFGDGWGFPLIKLLMIVVVIHVIDSELKADLGGDENMAGLVKLAVFILGFAPGTRDVLRVVMGI